MELPTLEDVHERRIERFNERITAALGASDLARFRDLIERYERERNVPAVEIAAELATLAQGKSPLFSDAAKPKARATEPATAQDAPLTHSQRRAARRAAREQAGAAPALSGAEKPRRHERAPAEAFMAKRQREREIDATLETYRIEVGRQHGVKPANIVGAIANEAGLEGRFIGRVVIEDDHSFVDLPPGMPKDVFRNLQKVRVAGQQLQISRALRTQVNKMRRERSEPPRPRRSHGKGPQTKQRR